MPKARALPGSIPASRSPGFHKWGDPSNPAHLSEAGDSIITSLQGRGRMELIVTLTLLQVRTKGLWEAGGPGPATATTTHLVLSHCLDTSSAFLRGLAPHTPISQMGK